LTIALAILITWLGLAVAYFSVYPVGFFVTTFGMAGFVVSVAIRWLMTHGQGRERHRAALT
jgi:zinc/manganese transport system permease protein